MLSDIKQPSLYPNLTCFHKFVDNFVFVNLDEYPLKCISIIAVKHSHIGHRPIILLNKYVH